MTLPEEAQSPLTVRLLGPFEARVHGSLVPRLRTRRGEWLLGLLALWPGRELDRAWLAGRLWPESLEPQALASLRRTLNDLRHALGPEVWRLRAPNPRTVALDLSDAFVDVAAFDRALARGDEASLAAAVSLYRGRLLEGCDEEWVLPERQARAEAYLRALEMLAERAGARDDPAAAARWLRQAAVVDPLRESTQRALMRALGHAGDYAAATAIYRDLRSRLHAEINAAPAPETVSLYERIREEARGRFPAAKPEVAGDGASGRGGEAGMKSGGGGKRWQPSQDEEARAGEDVGPSPSPQTLDLAASGYSGGGRSLALAPSPALEPLVPVARLPRPISGLIGRQREADEIKSCLGTSRLVTLTGVGGVGKTRLAIRVAEEVSDDYGDGVCFVELAGLADPALVAGAVAAAFGLRAEPGRSLERVLADALAPRHVLIVLDNCEHMLEACAALADRLLRACPNLRILATSRQAFGITGEIAWRVPGLSLPGEVEGSGLRVACPLGSPGLEIPTHPLRRVPTLQAPGGSDPSTLDPSELPRGHPTPNPEPSTINQYEAVMLFVERARAASPGFALTAENAPLVVQLCQRLDGVPLALELAAARVKVLTVEQIARRLNDRFRLLTAGSRTALARQQTLRATMDWSHDLLSEEEQALFRRLSVFAGGWTLEAAEEVCGDCEVRNSDCGMDLTPRPPLHGMERGPGGEVESAFPIPQSAVLDLLTSLVDKSLVVVEGIDRGAQGEARYRFLETTRAYARECLEASGEDEAVRRRHAEYFLGLAEAASPELVGPDAVHWLDRLESALDNLRSGFDWYARPHAGEEELEAAARMAIALQLFWRTRALPLDPDGWVRRLTSRRDAVGRTAVWAAVLRIGVETSGSRLEAAAARAQIEESLAISRELNDAAGTADALRALGDLARRDGDATAAGGFYAQSLRIARTLQDPLGIAESLTRFAGLAARRGDYDAARSLYEEALALYRQAGYRLGSAGILTNLGGVAYAQGDYIAARSLHQECLALARELGHHVGVAWSLANLAESALALGEPQAALKFYAEGLRIFQALGHQFGTADCLAGLAEILRAHGRPPEAIVRAARLMGATQALRDASGFSPAPIGLIQWNRSVEAARAALGEETFAAAWSEGRALPLEEALSSALQGAAEAISAAPASRANGSTRTRPTRC